MPKKSVQLPKNPILPNEEHYFRQPPWDYNGKKPTPKRQMKFRVLPSVSRLLAQVVGAEQMRRPDERISKQSILTEAFLMFVRERNSDLLLKHRSPFLRKSRLPVGRTRQGT